jgi:hypothetical protein
VEVSTSFSKRNRVPLQHGKQASRRSGQVVLADVYWLPVRTMSTTSVGPPGFQLLRTIPLPFMPFPQTDDILCCLPQHCHPWLISIMTTNRAEKGYVKCFHYKGTVVQFEPNWAQVWLDHVRVHSWSKLIVVYIRLYLCNTYIDRLASWMALEPTQPVRRILGALSPEVKRPGRKTDHSPPSIAKVKNAWSYTSTPPYLLITRCLSKHRIRFHGTVFS